MCKKYTPLDPSLFISISVLAVEILSFIVFSSGGGVKGGDYSIYHLPCTSSRREIN
jgi:hypothetical protein